MSVLSHCPDRTAGAIPATSRQPRTHGGLALPEIRGGRPREPVGPWSDCAARRWVLAIPDEGIHDGGTLEKVRVMEGVS